ncbi:amidase signature domain-containing protein [Trichoderma chlorosporum]
MSGRHLLHAFMVMACSLPFSHCAPGNEHAKLPSLLDATLEELQSGLNAGHFTSVDLIRAYTARIEEVNPRLHAVNDINPDAISIAAHHDALRGSGSIIGPLHGIPVVLKDNIATADKMNNTAGSYALVGAEVPEDSTVARKLREAGAILLGKANLSQWSGARGAITQGWSAYGGQCVGAYYFEMDPDGSSSGSATAASVGLTWAALGTDTTGSIADPSSKHNLVGIKPTMGLTSRYLVVPISEHQDTVGPMARTVKDAAYLLSAIAGSDGNDNYTSASPFGDDVPDYAAACVGKGLHGRRIGVPRHILQLGSQKPTDYMLKIFNSALDVLRAQGAEIVDDIFLPGAEDLVSHKYSPFVTGPDLMVDIPRYFSQLKTNPNNITTMVQLREFIQKDAREGFPEKNTASWDRGLSRGYDNTSPVWWENYSAQAELAGPQGIAGAVKNHSLDAIVLPTEYASNLAAPLGNPVITVPMGRTPDDSPLERNAFGTLNVKGPNMPFGLGFTGARFSEEVLLEIAYAFEQATMVRKTIIPYIQPKTELKDILEKTENTNGNLEL